MEYREHAPPAALAPFIRCFWTLSGAVAAPAVAPERLIPDGSPELVVHLGDPFEQVMEPRAAAENGAEGGRRHTQPAALVAGQLRGPLLIAPTGRIDIVAARFRPAGLAPFLGGIAAEELTDRRVAVGDFSAALDRALDRVRAAASGPERLRAFAAVIAERLEAGPRLAFSAVAAAAGLIERTGGSATLAEVGRAVGLHERSLQRGFRREVGISAKRFARVIRFQRFFRAFSAAPAGGIAGLALDCGYYDQAHLLREARELAGGATGSLAEGTTLSRLFSRGGELPVSGTSNRRAGAGRDDRGSVRTPDRP